MNASSAEHRQRRTRSRRQKRQPEIEQLKPIDTSQVRPQHRHVAEQLPEQLTDPDAAQPFILPPFRISDVMKRRGLAKTAHIHLKIQDSRSLDIGFKVYTEKSFRNDKTHYSRGVFGWVELEDLIVVLRRHAFPVEEVSEDAPARSREFVMVNTTGPIDESTPLFAVVSDLPMELLLFPKDPSLPTPRVEILGTSVIREGEVAIYGLGEEDEEDEVRQQQLHLKKNLEHYYPASLTPRRRRRPRDPVPQAEDDASDSEDPDYLPPTRKRARYSRPSSAAAAVPPPTPQAASAAPMPDHPALLPASSPVPGHGLTFPHGPQEIAGGLLSMRLPAYSGESYFHPQQQQQQKPHYRRPVIEFPELPAAVEDDAISVNSWAEGSDSEYEDPYMGYEDDSADDATPPIDPHFSNYHSVYPPSDDSVMSQWEASEYAPDRHSNNALMLESLPSKGPLPGYRAPTPPTMLLFDPSHPSGNTVLYNGKAPAALSGLHRLLSPAGFIQRTPSADDGFDQPLFRTPHPR